MLFFDAIIRYGCIAVLLLFAAFAARDGWRVPAARWGVALTISVAAMLIGTAPAGLQPPFWLYVPVRLLDMVNIVLVWIFCRALLEDDFRAGWLEWGALAVYMVMTLPFRLMDFGLVTRQDSFFWLDASQDVMSLAMFVHLMYAALHGRADDLVEPRRRARLMLILLAGVGTIFAVFAENLFSRDHEPLVSIFRAAVALVATLWGIFWLLRLHPELLAFQPLQEPGPSHAPTVDARDASAHARLLEIMQAGAYAEPGLTIGGLADKVGVPEHQLRALINQSLGYRNFSAFLNQYRIDAAKAALSDPDQGRTPVLTIAMDTGFGSLAPFNRAFKAAENTTPTQFRKLAMEKLVDPEKG